MDDTADIEIEETLEPQAHGGSLKREKKIDAAGISYYGPDFVRYMKIAEYRDLIPGFKDLYYERMLRDTDVKIIHLLKEYNQTLKEIGRSFHPHTKVVRDWRAKWNKDILEKKGMMLENITTKKNVQQVLKTRANGEGGVVQYGAPSYVELESAVQTLGGELANDALQMLRDDQDLEDNYDTDELVKRKNYVLNVFGHVTKMVHGKAAIMLKASQEKRENAGFLMELMRKATAGKMSAEEVTVLEGDYQVKPTENVS